MNPVSRIISKFGTQEKLAAALGTRQNVISAWKRRGYVPARQQPRVLEAARLLNIPLTPSDFFDLGGESPNPEAHEVAAA